MLGNIRVTTASLICGTITLCVIVGCAKRNDQFPDARSRHERQAAAESSFAAGAGRKPTAATSFAFAKILVGQGRDRDALYVLSHIVREHPKFLPAYNEMAGIYVRADRLDDAVAALQSGLEEAPSDGVLHNNLGMCYLLKEDPEKALDAFTRATEAVPNSATFRSNRAAALALTSRTAEAESEYRTVVGTHQARQNVRILQQAQAKAARSPGGPDQNPGGVVDGVETTTPNPDAPQTPAPAPAPAGETERGSASPDSRSGDTPTTDARLEDDESIGGWEERA